MNEELKVQEDMEFQLYKIGQPIGDDAKSRNFEDDHDLDDLLDLMDDECESADQNHTEKSEDVKQTGVQLLMESLSRSLWNRCPVERGIHTLSAKLIEHCEDQMEPRYGSCRYLFAVADRAWTYFAI